MDRVDQLAEILWNFNILNQTVEPADCIIVLGNSDVRTAQRAAELFNQGCGNWLVTTGAFGRLTKDKFKKPEAKIFADETMRLGVPKEKIIMEDRSTNTFDNVRFTKQIMKARNILISKVIVVTKPYMERRAFATFQSTWPGIKVVVTSPNLDFEEYPNESTSKELLVNMLVGDQQRLMIFSESGNIPKQQFPENVLQAFHELVGLGFNKQIIPDENIPNLLAVVSSGTSN